MTIVAQEEKANNSNKKNLLMELQLHPKKFWLVWCYYVLRFISNEPTLPSFL
jgi:hypothetical protein